jgi:protein O-mannosyl-transferase
VVKGNGKKAETMGLRQPKENTARPAVPGGKDAGRPRVKAEYLICLALVVLTLSVYAQIAGHDFLKLDDDVYITENRQVSSGLNAGSVAWAFTTIAPHNWHPLTWLSHMADVEIYGMDPAGHHRTSLLFHVLNSLLLFAVFRRMTGALWRSGLVAALFALHPLHVESVAWVAERKDLLSAFFWMLTLLAYSHYARRPGLGRYGSVVLFFLCGLMSKPMVVTLPLVLLLLDFWPLGRMHPRRISRNDGVATGAESSIARLIGEKLPLIVLTTGASIVTLAAQRGAGAVASLDMVPFGIRLANAAVSYGKYFSLTLWPHPLSAWYPHPGMPPAWQVVAASLFLITGFSLSVVWLRKRPWFTVGWLWWVGTLVPVIGLVQVGSQAMADRYTYIPLTGLFVIVAWGADSLMGDRRRGAWARVLVAAAVLSGCTLLSFRQAGYWKDTVTLFRQVLATTGGDRFVHLIIAQGLVEAGRDQEAYDHYLSAVMQRPDDSPLPGPPGEAPSRTARGPGAVLTDGRAISLDPSLVKAYNNMGNILAGQGKAEAAAEFYRVALGIDPCYAEAHNNLGVLLAGRNDGDGAMFHFRQALACRPDYRSARLNLSRVLSRNAGSDRP